MSTAALTHYELNVINKKSVRFLGGVIVRFKQYIKYWRAVRLARSKGATIGEDVVMPLSLAKKANKNLTIGSHTSIQTDKIDTRSPISIGSHVIIGQGTEIITTSHDINSVDWEHKYYGIKIEDYVWLPTNVMVLPSCRNIGYGAVVSSGSVVVRDVEAMSVVGGNPAKEFKKRECVHSDLVVESLLGGDLHTYIKARKRKHEV